jgi:hypothetical protein
VTPDFGNFLKFKLLVSFQSQSERGKDLVTSILTTEKLEDRELTEGLSSATPARLRMRLFSAVERDRGHDAFMVLGPIEEKDLDPGELRGS